MKERPILMTPANAQKCHDGTKTQTRRIVKLNHAGRAVRAGRNWHLDDPDAVKACPYGQPGDRLWVRETFALWREGFDRRGHVIYRADMKDKAGEDFSRPDLIGLSKWYPSIHMPRLACRTVLEITEIRVQRLQEISEEDAIAEGCQLTISFHESRTYTAREQFLTLWESINGAGSWAANPWVWCVSFKKVQP